ncbi:MAG TPA: hypothetical protein VF465_13995 [Flavobacterium sp.]
MEQLVYFDDGSIAYACSLNSLMVFFILIILYILHLPIFLA